MAMEYCLKWNWLLFTMIGLTVGSTYYCPDEFVEDWVETAGRVQASLRNIFSKTLNNPSIANDSLSYRETYEIIAINLKVPVTLEGFDNFQEAINEITAATLAARSDYQRERVQVNDISGLVKNLTAFVDAKNMGLVHKIYGKLLYLQKLISDSDAAKIKRRTEVDHKSLPFTNFHFSLLEEFFDSLDGHQLGTIFGIPNVSNPNTKPTLAFAVDDTGSMFEEINSVKKLIYSFIKTERSEPHAYILTTFNDPGKYIHRSG